MLSFKLFMPYYFIYYAINLKSWCYVRETRRSEIPVVLARVSRCLCNSWKWSVRSSLLKLSWQFIREFRVVVELAKVNEDFH